MSSEHEHRETKGTEMKLSKLRHAGGGGGQSGEGDAEGTGLVLEISLLGWWINCH